MLFRKKRGMIDVGELAKQGKIVPLGKSALGDSANREGFVELGKTNNRLSPQKATGSTMDFFNATPSTPSSPNSNTIERITALSQKISKIEQRLELIERKLGVGDSSPPLMW